MAVPATSGALESTSSSSNSATYPSLSATRATGPTSCAPSACPIPPGHSLRFQRVFAILG
ncbi:uncharacterized protein J3R85_000723 [Psidium guajava]|nr:uncharacterized protein J3R85_000723 [Psidium guajava]